jgi:hypothetical protein
MEVRSLPPHALDANSMPSKNCFRALLLPINFQGVLWAWIITVEGTFG